MIVRIFVVCMSLVCLNISAEEFENQEIAACRAKFEAHYEAWKKDCAKVKYSSVIDSRLQSEHFQAILKMGPEILPLVAEKCIQDTDFQWRGWIWTSLTRMQNDPTINPWAKDTIKTWWEGGAKLAKARTTLLLNEMKKAKEEGRVNDVEKAQQGLRALGILSLETLFEELETGVDDVAPIIQSILSGETKVTDKAQMHDWWRKNKHRYALPRGTTTAAKPTNASALYEALMDARTSGALTNVLVQYHALPLERQEVMLALCHKGMDNPEKVLIEEVAKQESQDLSVVCGRCAWFAGRVLDIQLPSMNAQTPRKEIAETKSAILKAIKERRKKAASTMNEVAQEPLDKRLALAQTDSTEPSLLSVLAEDADATVRLAVAANSKTPPSALAKLASGDANAEVRKTALENLEKARTVIPPEGRRK